MSAPTVESRIATLESDVRRILDMLANIVLINEAQLKRMKEAERKIARINNSE
jgi:hypothetical protein